MPLPHVHVQCSLVNCADRGGWAGASTSARANQLVHRVWSAGGWGAQALACARSQPLRGRCWGRRPPRMSTQSPGGRIGLTLCGTFCPSHCSLSAPSQAVPPRPTAIHLMCTARWCCVVLCTCNTKSTFVCSHSSCNSSPVTNTFFLCTPPPQCPPTHPGWLLPSNCSSNLRSWSSGWIRCGRSCSALRGRPTPPAWRWTPRPRSRCVVRAVVVLPPPPLQSAKLVECVLFRLWYCSWLLLTCKHGHT